MSDYAKELEDVEKRKRLGARDAAVILGIIFDKSRLLRDRPTEITGSIQLARRREAAEALAARFGLSVQEVLEDLTVGEHGAN